MPYPISRLEEARNDAVKICIPGQLSRYTNNEWMLTLAASSAIRWFQTAALADYVLDKNIDSFWSYYHQGAELMYDLFKQWQAGETNLDFQDIDTDFKGILMALMVGANELASKIAVITDTTALLENRPTKHKRINKSHYNYYKLIRAIQDEDKTPEQIEEYHSGISKDTKSGPGAGMIGSFLGIALKDQAIFDDGIAKMHKTHAVRTRPNQVFGHAPEYYLCPWGVRNAVLGVRAGLEFKLESKWIPQDLVLGLAERNPETQK